MAGPHSVCAAHLGEELLSLGSSPLVRGAIAKAFKVESLSVLDVGPLPKAGIAILRLIW